MKIANRFRLGPAFAVALVLPSVAASAGTVDRIRQAQTVRIAYRQDAPPFSYKDKIGEPAGLMVDLCREVAKNLAEQLQLPSLTVSNVPVSAADRFEAVSQQKADLLCEATSATLSRREQVDFSIATFVDGAGLLVRANGPKDLRAMASQKIGVLAGTTTEEALRNTLNDAGIAADVVTVKTHGEGLAMLDEGKISAYFADRSILLSLARDSKALGRLRLADDHADVVQSGGHRQRLAQCVPPDQPRRSQGTWARGLSG